MADYVPGGSGAGALIVSGTNEFITDAGKQVPGAPPDNANDRMLLTPSQSFTKSPNAVQIGSLTNKVGFFFGSSASFAEKATSEGPQSSEKSALSASVNYSNPVKYADGTMLKIHPTAWSGSVADDDEVTFVYYSGKSTGQR
tara:strand:- start:310 stop:735 length:426 start_codon:yes stop_codon:yes gene_type:complete